MITKEIYHVNAAKPESQSEKDLYWDYKNELWELTGEQGVSKEECLGWYSDILKSEIYLIRIFDDSIQIGFMFIGINTNCHPDAEFYVQDCYIIEDYRRQHIMSDAFQQFLAEHPGDYCLFLIDTNAPAIAFWNKQFGINSYEEYELEDFNGMNTETCHIHGYRRIL